MAASWAVPETLTERRFEVSEEKYKRANCPACKGAGVVTSDTDSCITYLCRDCEEESSTGTVTPDPARRAAEDRIALARNFARLAAQCESPGIGSLAADEINRLCDEIERLRANVRDLERVHNAYVEQTQDELKRLRKLKDAADRMRGEITHYHTLGTAAYDSMRKEVRA